MAFAGAGTGHEVKDAREGPSQAGQDRHRLPEASRRVFQVANETEDDDSRGSVLRGEGVRNKTQGKEAR